MAYEVYRHAWLVKAFWRVQCDCHPGSRKACRSCRSACRKPATTVLAFSSRYDGCCERRNRRISVFSRSSANRKPEILEAYAPSECHGADKQRQRKSDAQSRSSRAGALLVWMRLDAARSAPRFSVLGSLLAF